MIKKLFISLILLYQKRISPFLVARCVFHPTCSEYARQTLQKRGVRGSFFPILCRLFSCHPFTKKNYWDPVK